MKQDYNMLYKQLWFDVFDSAGYLVMPGHWYSVSEFVLEYSLMDEISIDLIDYRGLDVKN